MPEAYLRGNTIKYIRVPDEVCPGGNGELCIGCCSIAWDSEEPPLFLHWGCITIFGIGIDCPQVMAKVQEENIRRDGETFPSLGVFDQSRA